LNKNTLSLDNRLRGFRLHLYEKLAKLREEGAVMTKRKKSLFRSASALILMVSILAISFSGKAETRSGFWTHIEQSAAYNAGKADFSEYSPFCAANGYSNTCSLKVADVDFSSYTKVSAPGGILYDSVLYAAIQREYLSGKTITLDREGLFYLDSMMKKRWLTAPMNGFAYADSCPLNRGVYFLKTSEDHYAMMAKVGEYIGGINRSYYYWAYRPENDDILYKETLFEQPESLSITVDAFSGRPNPVFILKDSAGIAEIVHQIYVSVNTLLDSSVKRTGDLQCSQSLGYRKMTVSGMFDSGDVPNSSYKPSIELCNAAITYYKVSPVSSIMPPQQLYDPQQRLEKLIIRVCCRLGLTATDSLGDVQFCALIPDSLKDFNSMQPDRPGVRGSGAVALVRLGRDRIVFSVRRAGAVRMEVLDIRGKRTVSIEGRFDRGEHAVKLGGCATGAGVYLVRVRAGTSVIVQSVPYMAF
jgi:hypothetical protein